MAEVVQLRFFGGLSVDETAEVLKGLRNHRDAQLAVRQSMVDARGYASGVNVRYACLTNGNIEDIYLHQRPLDPGVGRWCVLDSGTQALDVVAMRVIIAAEPESVRKPAGHSVTHAERARVTVENQSYRFFLLIALHG